MTAEPPVAAPATSFGLADDYPLLSDFSPRGTFPTIEEAIAVGQSIYTEYGLSFSFLDDPPREGVA